MLVMCYEIRIGEFTLKGIDSVSVESSIDLLSDQCVIILPGSAYNQALLIEDKIKRGDKVTVKLGYNNDLKTEFTGYLRTISADSPMRLECEDGAFLFRKPVKDRRFKKVTAITVLRYVVSQVNAQLPKEQRFRFVTNISGLQYKEFTLLGANGLQALEKIKEDMHINIYCRTSSEGINELHCHMLYSEKRGEVKYDFSRNIEDSDNLKYVRKEDVKLRVVVEGRTKKKQIKAEVGEKGANTFTLKRPGISTFKTLSLIAKQTLLARSYDGYQGAIRGWLIPFVQIGCSAKIVDTEYKEREGSYFVNGVKTSFSREGGVRTVALGIKVGGVSAKVNALPDQLPVAPGSHIDGWSPLPTQTYSPEVMPNIELEQWDQSDDDDEPDYDELGHVIGTIA